MKGFTVLGFMLLGHTIIKDNLEGNLSIRLSSKPTKEKQFEDIRYSKK